MNTVLNTITVSVISEGKLLFLAIFSSIGVITTLILTFSYLYYLVGHLKVKYRKNCYQCGDDIDKTYKFGEGYYCSYCIERGHAERNEAYHVQQRE